MNETNTPDKQVIDLQVGDQIDLYGPRTVIDVHNLHHSYGGKVRLTTTNGTFVIDRFKRIPLVGKFK